MGGRQEAACANNPPFLDCKVSFFLTIRRYLSDYTTAPSYHCHLWYSFTVATTIVSLSMAMLMALGDLLESQERWLYTLWIRLTVPFTDFSPFGDLTAGLHQNTNCIFGRALLGDMQTWLGPCECQLDSRFPVSAGSRSTRDARACHLVALTVSVSEASCNTFIVNTRSTSNTSTVTCFLSNAHAWSLG